MSDQQPVCKLTCLTCRVMFTVADAHRAHFQYNLKRKVAELEPITQTAFEEKAAAAAVSESAEVAARCHACAKTFASYAQLENHTHSKKHKEKMDTAASTPVVGAAGVAGAPAEDVEQTKMVVDDDGVESDWTDESEDGSASAIDNSADAIVPGTCLFCATHCADVAACLAHMYGKHGFFVPDVEYCVDVHGLLAYLGFKVGVGHECVQCAHAKDYRTAGSAQRHMRDKGHTTLRADAAAMLELDAFYDYSPSYPDADGHQADEDVDEDHLLKYAALDQGWQLQLPSGATVGHRSLARYYRQHLRAHPQVRAAGLADQHNRSVVDKLMLEYGGGRVARAGGTALMPAAMTKELAQRKARDQKYMHRQMAKHSQRLGVHNNKLFVTSGRIGDN